MINHKELYGLRSIGIRWHKRLDGCLRDMGYSLCKTKPDIWMREKYSLYEYIAVYVDNLAISAKDPKEITDALTNKYRFKLKGAGSITYHLGCDFFSDADGILCFSPRKYIEKMIEGYIMIFGRKPKQNVSSPLEKEDAPELDDSDYLDFDGIAIYQSMIRSLQWVVSLGRIDI